MTILIGPPTLKRLMKEPLCSPLGVLSACRKFCVLCWGVLCYWCYSLETSSTDSTETHEKAWLPCCPVQSNQSDKQKSLDFFQASYCLFSVFWFLISPSVIRILTQVLFVLSSSFYFSVSDLM